MWLRGCSGWLLGVGEKKIDPSMHHNTLSNDSGSILRISESILSLVFNQMCNDAEFALEIPVFCSFPISHIHTYIHTYTTRTFRKIIFHKVRKG